MQALWALRGPRRPPLLLPVCGPSWPIALPIGWPLLQIAHCCARYPLLAAIVRYCLLPIRFPADARPRSSVYKTRCPLVRARISARACWSDRRQRRSPVPPSACARVLSLGNGRAWQETVGTLRFACPPAAAGSMPTDIAPGGCRRRQ
jgi:hypothetical protein